MHLHLHLLIYLFFITTAFAYFICLKKKSKACLDFLPVDYGVIYRKPVFKLWIDLDLESTKSIKEICLLNNRFINWNLLWFSEYNQTPKYCFIFAFWFFIKGRSIWCEFLGCKVIYICNWWPFDVTLLKLTAVAVSDCNPARYLSGHCGHMSRVSLLLGGKSFVVDLQKPTLLY